MQSARHAGCQTTDETAAYAAAKWECPISQARTRIPPFEAYLNRVDRNNAILSVTCHYATQILGWDKVVLVRDCGETMQNNPIMESTCNVAMPSFFDKINNGVMFQLFTHGNSETVDHGESVMDSGVRQGCVLHSQEAAVNGHNNERGQNESTGQIRGTFGAQALMLAIESASRFERTHIVVIVADRYREVDWNELKNAKESGTNYVYITALTVGNHAEDMMHIADNVVHWDGEPDGDGPGVFDLMDALVHANSHVSTGLRMSVRTSCTEKPYFGCQVLPSVSRSTPHAKTVIGGCVTELLTVEKNGIDAFLRRDIEDASENGVHWCGSRMLIRNDNLRQWVPAVDTARVQWRVHTRKVPLVYKVPFRTMVRLNDRDNTSSVTVQLENGRDTRTVTLKATRARTLTRVSASRDIAAEARWRPTMAYIYDSARHFQPHHLDEIISRAPCNREKRVWMEQKRLLREGQHERAARVADHRHMMRVHQIQ